MNSIYPLLPGTGTVLGHPEVGGTRRISFSIVGTLRSTFSPTLTNEARYGIAPGGNSIFREEISPALFSQWKGYVPAIGYVTDPYRTSSQSRRNTPVTTLTDNLTWAQQQPHPELRRQLHADQELAADGGLRRYSPTVTFAHQHHRPGQHRHHVALRYRQLPQQLRHQSQRCRRHVRHAHRPHLAA